jgi:hypothetical protein
MSNHNKIYALSCILSGKELCVHEAVDWGMEGLLKQVNGFLNVMLLYSLYHESTMGFIHRCPSKSSFTSLRIFLVLAIAIIGWSGWSARNPLVHPVQEQRWCGASPQLTRRHV